MGKSRAFMWILVLAFCAAAVCCAGAEAEKPLTLMVYMAGSDLETQNGAATADIQEMIGAGCDYSQANIVILAGGAEHWQMGFSAGELTVAELGARGMRIRDRWPGASMGEPETLSSFLAYAAENYPAREYALIIWNHGGGPLEGVCYDELYNSDRLSLEDLQNALEESPFGENRKLSWIGFDACLMASLETAIVCSDFAKYMIASQETEPAAGWNYSFLNHVAENPDGSVVGPAVVDAYMQANPDIPTLTLSCIDLSRVGLVRIAVSNLFQRLRDQLNRETFSSLSNRRRDTRSFGRRTTLSDYDLADLYHLSEQYSSNAPELAEAVQAALDYAVIYNSSHQENAHGLSLYSPYYNKKTYQSGWIRTYEKLELPTSYLSWIRRYSSFWLGDQLADWSNLRGSALPAAEDGSQTLEMTLTKEQQEHFATAKLVILRDQGYDNAYFQVYEQANLEPENGVLRADYDFRCLYVIDEHGNPVSDAYPFFTAPEGQYAVIADLETTSLYRNEVLTDRGEASDYRSRFVNLLCSLDPETDTLVVEDVIAQPETPGELTTGKQYLSINASAWPYIFFSANRYSYLLARDEDTGRILPYTQWPEATIPVQNRTMIDGDGSILSISEWSRRYHEQTADEQDWLYFSEVDNTRPWSLQFKKGLDSSQQFYAQFIVTDTQGVESATELIPLHYPARKDAQQFDRELYRDEEVAIGLESIEVIRAESGSGLYFRFRIENNTNRTLGFFTADMALNRTTIDATNLLLPNGIAPHSVMRESVCLPAEDIPYLEGKLEQVEFMAAVWQSGSVQTSLKSIPVKLDTSIDLGALEIPEPGRGEVLAETEEEGLTVRLMDVKEGKEGILEGKLHFINRGRRTFEIMFFRDETYALGDAILNGNFFRDVLHATYGSVLVPVGYDLYIPFTLDRRMQLDPVGKAPRDPLFSCTDGFDYWGITELRSVTLPLIINGDSRLFHFTLHQPLPLTYRPQGAETGSGSTAGQLLLKNGQLMLELRSVRMTEDGHLRLHMDICNQTGRNLAFRMPDCMLEDQYAAAAYAAETSLQDDEFVSGWITVTAEEGAHRMVADLIPSEDIGRAREAVSVFLTFELAEKNGYEQYEYELDWKRSNEAMLMRLGGTAESSAEGAWEQWQVVPAEMLPELDLDKMFGGKPELPEHWQQAAGSVRLALSENQSVMVRSASVSLVLPCGTAEQPETYYRIAELTGLRKNGNELAADFCGLLAAATGNDLPFYQCVYSKAGTWHFLIQDLIAEVPGEMLYAQHAHLTLGGDGASAATGEYLLWQDDTMQNKQAVLTNGLEIWRIPGLADGEPPHCSRWEYLMTTDHTAEIPEGSPAFSFQPAAAWKNLWAVFSITNTDGSQYAVAMPYEP
ncbi:MAG: hypothetical protein IJG94_11370 [Clostridia bacterium]|nr:hypothetical protein [Clostridia bacterium]